MKPKTLRPHAVCLFGALLGWVAIAGTPGPSQRQGEPFEKFAPNPQWLVKIDGQQDQSARIYLCPKPVAFVITGPQFSKPLLVWPSGRRVEVLGSEAIAVEPQGDLTLASDYKARQTVSYSIKEDGAEFDLEGRRIHIYLRPPLLKHQTAQQIQDYDDRFRQRADDYQPDWDQLSQIRSFPQPATITTYLGTSCPHCQAEVPKLMRLERELQGSKIRFTYYGMPYHPLYDPEIPAEIQEPDGSLKGSIPIVVVSVEGKIVGWFDRRSFQMLEAKLTEILSKATL